MSVNNKLRNSSLRNFLQLSETFTLFYPNSLITFKGFWRQCVLLRQTLGNIQNFSHKTQSGLVVLISPTAYLVPGNIIFYTIHFTNCLSSPKEYNFVYQLFHQQPILFQGIQFCIPPISPTAYLVPRNTILYTIRLCDFLTHSTQKDNLYVLIPLRETARGGALTINFYLPRNNCNLTRHTIFQH
jgi:hypothetical protein